MVRFLNKETELWRLETLFALLHENMKEVAPSGCTYEEEKREWLLQVGSGLKKAPRQIVILEEDGQINGYLQYYVNQEAFMVEEIQLRRSCQATTAFFTLWKYMADVIPAETPWIEAYADKRNLASRNLMAKLGMKEIGETPDGRFLHLRGALKQLPGFGN